MELKIKCSLGEIIDKYTILMIKLKKSNNEEQKNNIKQEYIELEQSIDINNNIIKEYIYKLFTINIKLWELEDLIRYLSINKIYDDKYINCSENIHKTNDERYKIKREINEKFNSEIKEEKILQTIYISSNNSQNIILKEIKINNLKLNDIILNSHELFHKNKYQECYKLLLEYINIYDYKEYIPNINPDINYTITLLYSSFLTIDNMLSIREIDTDCFDYLYKYIDLIENKNFVDYFKRQYIKINLYSKKYQKVKSLIKYLNPVENNDLNISPDTSFYPQYNKMRKTPVEVILIYSSGGLGDVIMLSRYMQEFCNFYNNYNIVYMLYDDKLYWLFSAIFKHVNNLQIKTMKTIDNIFDYHINLHELPFILEKEYSNINNNYYLKNIVGSNIDLNSIINKNKKNIIINWKGNKLNLNENCRSIDLELLINILKKHNNLNYISINKNLNDKEKNILKDNNILDLSNIIDCGNNSFYDTITILNNIDLVVSTDTSIVHLAGSMGIETICLLSRMREWRWTNDNNTNWYPKMKLLRQNELLNWNNVLELLDNYLSKL